MLKSNPFKILTPNERWAPSQRQIDDAKNEYDKLLPPDFIDKFILIFNYLIFLKATTFSLLRGNTPFTCGVISIRRGN